MLLAALALVGVASAVRTATVAVGDTSLVPTRVRVDARGSVTWRNVGARPHRIASRTGAFAAFTLAPRARKTVRFTRNGPHRYTVDGTRCGIVYVGVPLGPGCSVGGGGAAAPPSTGTKVYAYNVVMRGSFKNVGYVDDGDTGRRYETWTHEYTWNSTFTNFKFKVVTAGAKFIGVNATGTLFASTARVTQTWDWFLQAQTQGPPNFDCEGASTGVVRSVLAASTSNLSTPNYRVAWQVPPWSKLLEIQASCNGSGPPTERTTPFKLADGTGVDLSVTTLLLEFERETGGLRNPAGALANGRSFRIDTGVKVSEEPSLDPGSHSNGKVTITERYIAVFTRRP